MSQTRRESPSRKSAVQADADAARIESNAFLRIIINPWQLAVVTDPVEVDGATYVSRQEHLAVFDEPMLLRIHNAATGTNLRRFPSHAVAIEKTWAGIGELFASPVAQTRLLQESADAEPSSVQPEQPNVLRETALRAEIAQLRKNLVEKVEDLRALAGGSPKAETATVARVLELLRRNGGATKEVLITETGAKKGYVDALLNRILPEKGYSIRANTVSGQRSKSYVIDSD